MKDSNLKKNLTYIIREESGETNVLFNKVGASDYQLFVSRGYVKVGLRKWFCTKKAEKHYKTLYGIFSLFMCKLKRQLGNKLSARSKCTKNNKQKN